MLKMFNCPFLFWVRLALLLLLLPHILKLLFQQLLPVLGLFILVFGLFFSVLDLFFFVIGQLIFIRNRPYTAVLLCGVLIPLIFFLLRLFLLLMLFLKKIR